MIQKKKVKLLLLLLVIKTTVWSQDFRHRWNLDTAERPGLHTISIDSKLTPFLKPDFSDLRVADETGNWVPYLITKTGTRWTSRFFAEFPILSYRLIDSGKSELILKDTSRQLLFKLQLFLENASVSRSATISGSADNKNWYIISDNIEISPSYMVSDSFSIQEISLPGSQYRYYKLVTDNAKNDPLNILKAGAYLNRESIWGDQLPYSLNPQPSIHQSDSAGRSLIKLAWSFPYHHEALLIDFSAPSLFRREMEIYIPYQGRMGQLIGHFILLSGNANKIEFPRIKTDSLYLVIHNDDNTPLTIDKVYSAYWKYSALAFWEPGKKYHLLLDNPEAVMPKYDLDFFRDSLQRISPAEISLKDSVLLIAPDSRDNRSEHQWWLWPALLSVIVSLAILAVRLMKEMKKSNP
jgi:hypothetical protein